MVESMASRKLNSRRAGKSKSSSSPVSTSIEDLTEQLESLKLTSSSPNSEPADQWVQVISHITRRSKPPTAKEYACLLQLLAKLKGRDKKALREGLVECGVAEVVLGALGRYLRDREIVGWGLEALSTLMVDERVRKIVKEMGLEGLLGSIERFGDDLWVVQQALPAIGNLVFGNGLLKKEVGAAGVVETICKWIGRFGRDHSVVAHRGLLALRNLCFECRENAVRLSQGQGAVTVFNVAEKWINLRNVRIHVTSLVASIVGLATAALTHDVVSSMASCLLLVGQSVWAEAERPNSGNLVASSNPSRELQGDGVVAESFFLALRTLSNDWRKEIWEAYPDITLLLLNALNIIKVDNLHTLEHLCVSLCSIIQVKGSLSSETRMTHTAAKILNILESSPLSEDLILSSIKILGIAAQHHDECVQVLLTEDAISLICHILETNQVHTEIQRSGCKILRILMQARRRHKDIANIRIPCECREAGKVAVFSLTAFPEEDDLLLDALKILEVIGRAHCIELGAEHSLRIVLGRRRARNDQSDGVISLGLSIMQRLNTASSSLMEVSAEYAVGASVEKSELWCRGPIGELSTHALNHGLVGIKRRRRRQKGLPPNVSRKKQHVKFSGKPTVRVV